MSSANGIGKDSIKSSLFTDDTMICFKTQENQLQQTLREFSDMVRYQINK